MTLIKEDNDLLNSIIDTRLNNDEDGSVVEFIIRPECNQKCDYCYLTQHGNESYPIKYRANKEVTINNLQKIVDYFLKNNYFIKELNIFAGDLFYDNLFFDLI